MNRTGEQLLLTAMRDKQEAQHRVWMAADEVNRLRARLIEAETILATEERSLGESQAMVRMVWEDFNPRTGRLVEQPEPVDA